jgi:hypothetical protein
MRERLRGSEDSRDDHRPLLFTPLLAFARALLRTFSSSSLSSFTSSGVASFFALFRLGVTGSSSSSSSPPSSASESSSSSEADSETGRFLGLPGLKAADNQSLIGNTKEKTSPPFHFRRSSPPLCWLRRGFVLVHLLVGRDRDDFFFFPFVFR